MSRIVIVIISFFLIIKCGNFFGNNVKLNNTTIALSGMALSKSDRFQGVTQASPGTTGGGIETFIPGTGVFVSQNPSVDTQKSLMRVKFHDDPVEIPNGNGILQISLELGYLENLFSEASIPPLDEVQLDIDFIEIQKVGDITSRKITPTSAQKSIKFVGSKRIVSIIPEMLLENGLYNSFRIVFRNQARAYYRQFYYPVEIKTPNLILVGGIEIRNKQVTNINLWTTKESGMESQGLLILPGANAYDVVTEIRENLQQRNQISLTLSIQEESRNYSHYPEEIYIGIISVTAITKDGQSFDLNSGAATFELLSLRNGAIGLIGSRELDPVNVDFVDVTFSRSAKLKVNGEILDTKFRNESQSKFRIPVRTSLKSESLTELFFSIDPRKSFFPIKEEWVFDPNLKSESVWQVSSGQLAVIYGKDTLLPNMHYSTSDLVLGGQVSTTTTRVKTDPKYGKMIITDFVFNIESVLKGKFEGSTINLSTPGGVFNGVRMRAFGMPEFTSHERCLLFLKKKGESYQLNGGMYAKYKL